MLKIRYDVAYVIWRILVMGIGMLLIGSKGTLRYEPKISLHSLC